MFSLVKATLVTHVGNDNGDKPNTRRGETKFQSQLVHTDLQVIFLGFNLLTEKFSLSDVMDKTES